MNHENKAVAGRRRPLKPVPVILWCLEDIDLGDILAGFKAPAGSKFSLPRIAFIGLFSNLSQTCQRHVAKTLGFEYYPDLPFGTADPVAMSQLTSKWSEIFANFTRLIVIGDHTITGWRDDGTPEMDYESAWRLFRAYQGREQPIFAECDIPIIMESELLQLHSEYPDINNSTSWHDEPKRPWPVKPKASKTLLDLV